jgi:hypothetical protein
MRDFLTPRAEAQPSGESVQLAETRDKSRKYKVRASCAPAGHGDFWSRVIPEPPARGIVNPLAHR